MHTGVIRPHTLFPSSPPSKALPHPTFHPLQIPKSPLCPQSITSSTRRRTLTVPKSSGTELSVTDQEWLKKLPEKKKPLYSHSLPCIEAWLKKLGFFQSREDRAVWYIEKPDWHAQLSLDITDLYIRFGRVTLLRSKLPFWIKQRINTPIARRNFGWVPMVNFSMDEAITRRYTVFFFEGDCHLQILCWREHHMALCEIPRYLKSGPGSLEKDIERRFSYALSREDIENAILGGP